MEFLGPLVIQLQPGSTQAYKGGGISNIGTQDVHQKAWFYRISARQGSREAARETFETDTGITRAMPKKAPR